MASLIGCGKANYDQGLDSAISKELSFLFVSAMHAHWSFVGSLGYSTAHNRLARDAFGRVIASYVADPKPSIDEQFAWKKRR